MMVQSTISLIGPKSLRLSTPGWPGFVDPSADSAGGTPAKGKQNSIASTRIERKNLHIFASMHRPVDNTVSQLHSKRLNSFCRRWKAFLTNTLVRRPRG